MALLVYSPKINERIKYAFKHIFDNVLGVDCSFSDDLEIFENFKQAKIAYSDLIFGDAITFKKHQFIDEENVKAQDLAFADWKGLNIPFKVDDSVFSFDVFSATFYFLSRYEEYVITERDEHLRFSGKLALAFKNDFVKRPIIDEWAFELAKIIQKKYPEFTIKQRRFKFIPTLDIDRPFYYRTDSFFKKTAKLFLMRFKKDPFDVYQKVKNWDAKFGLNTIYFFLIGNEHINDMAPSIQNRNFRKVLKETSKHHQIGIHPSYFAFLNPDKVIKEKEILSKILSRKIEISRQHYLLLSFPKTYKALIKAGIKEDYTLTFADVAGFRASTCTPFFWYNLEAEKPTDLLLYPTAVMDQTLKKYMGLSTNEAEELLTEIMSNVRAVNGTFISLWHNESVSDFASWKGWEAVYLKMLSFNQQN